MTPPPDPRLAEHLERLQAMAEDDGETWDLSPNDQAALRAVLQQVRVLQDALQQARDDYNCARSELSCITDLVGNRAEVGTVQQVEAYVAEAKAALHQEQAAHQYTIDMERRCGRLLVELNRIVGVPDDSSLVAEIKLLVEARAALHQADQRIADAGARVGIAFGCDTADWLAEEILSLRGALDAERAKTQHLPCVQVDFSCGCSTPHFDGQMALATCDVHRDGRPVRLRTVPLQYWQCFHCGETFTTLGSARDHFGAVPECEAGCVIDRVAIEEGGKAERGRGLLMALRKAEAQLAAAQATIAKLKPQP